MASASPGVLRALLIAVRPKQWTKNLIVFFALFFTVGDAWGLNDPGGALSLVGKATLAFALFSALSSAVYLFNDICDLERDRRHGTSRVGLATALRAAAGRALCTPALRPEYAGRQPWSRPTLSSA